MKVLIFLSVSILSLAIILSAKNPGPEKGIHFFKGNWDQALQKAREENKPIFLDIYASWCGPCKLLDHHTFSNSAVGDYYNAHFINVSVNGEEGEGAELAKKFAIVGYPSLIFLDHTGRVIFSDAGYRGPKDFIKTGEAALSSQLKITK